MSDIQTFKPNPSDVRSDKVGKVSEPTAFESRLLNRFKKSLAGTLMSSAELRFRSMAFLWNYVHHQLWRFDSVPGSRRRFKSQIDAFNYYKIAESTARHHVKIARDFMEKLHPDGIPDHCEFTAEMAMIAFEMWRDENKLHAQTPDKLLLLSHDDEALEQAKGFTANYARFIRKRNKQKDEKKALLKGLTRQEKAIRGAQADVVQFIEETIPSIVNNATTLYSWLSNDNIKISTKQRGEIEFAAKYFMYCVLFTADSIPVNYLTYKAAVDIASHKGFDALEQESKPAYYALRYSFADILQQFNEASGKQTEDRHGDA